MDRNILWAFFKVSIVISFILSFYLNDFKVDSIYFWVIIVVLTVTYPVTVVFGIPSYLIFKRFNFLSLKVCVIYACVMGALIGAMLTLHALYGFNNYYAKQEFLVHAGHITRSGYRKVLEMSLVCGMSGVIGGLVFWKSGIIKCNLRNNTL